MTVSASLLNPVTPKSGKCSTYVLSSHPLSDQKSAILRVMRLALRVRLLHMTKRLKMIMHSKHVDKSLENCNDVALFKPHKGELMSCAAREICKHCTCRCGERIATMDGICRRGARLSSARVCGVV
jgi:hypothetical protein